MPCENKPKNSKYIFRGVSTSECPYECDEGLDPVFVNPLCQNIFEAQVAKMGGVISTLGIMTLFFVFCLILWASLLHRSK